MSVINLPIQTLLFFEIEMRELVAPFFEVYYYSALLVFAKVFFDTYVEKTCLLYATYSFTIWAA